MAVDLVQFLTSLGSALAGAGSSLAAVVKWSIEPVKFRVGELERRVTGLEGRPVGDSPMNDVRLSNTISQIERDLTRLKTDLSSVKDALGALSSKVDRHEVDMRSLVPRDEMQSLLSGIVEDVSRINADLAHVNGTLSMMLR